MRSPKTIGLDAPAPGSGCCGDGRVGRSCEASEALLVGEHRVRVVEAISRARGLSGQADFASMARKMSQDTSAEQGGDLGWASPGMFVPEFEEAMGRLQEEGAVSPPVVSRFGVHLIQLNDRRRVELSPQQVRESVRAQLRQSRYEEAYTAWARDVRARAFVELREAPL